MRDLDGKTYIEEDILETYLEALEEFKRDNPSFIGFKIIYSPYKGSFRASVPNYFDNIHRLHTKYPNLFAGFDMTGQEDKMPELVSFAKNILQLPKDIKFFFHAGETNWFGSIDENLVIIVVCVALKMCFLISSHLNSLTFVF